MPAHKKTKATAPPPEPGPEPRQEHFILRLYVAGTTPQSTRAILNARKLTEEYLAGRFELEVIDIYQQPTLARDEQIVAVPTLVRRLPLPLRKLVGDLSNSERVLIGLDLLDADRVKLAIKLTRRHRRSDVEA
jgi:circadian clock protein KaiB